MEKLTKREKVMLGVGAGLSVVALGTAGYFGVKYYRFVPEADEVAAHYEAQLVDSEHPWKEGLEPRVVEENEELVLGWFEPNTATVEGLTNQITTL